MTPKQPTQPQDHRSRSDQHGKVKVPLPKQLYSEKLVQAQFYVYIIAFSLLLIGILADASWLIHTALCGWLALSLIYTANVFRILFHKNTTSHGHIPQ